METEQGNRVFNFKLAAEEPCILAIEPPPPLNGKRYLWISRKCLPHTAASHAFGVGNQGGAVTQPWVSAKRRERNSCKTQSEEWELTRRGSTQSPRLPQERAAQKHRLEFRENIRLSSKTCSGFSGWVPVNFTENPLTVWLWWCSQLLFSRVLMKTLGKEPCNRLYMYYPYIEI